MMRALNARFAGVRDRLAGRSDAGVTLVELLVVMVVTSVMATAVMITVLQALRATRSADGRQDRAAQARIALDGATTVLRTASLYTNSDGVDVPAFDRITPTEVVFRGNLSNIATTSGAADAAPTLFRITLDTSDPQDSKLVEQRWKSTTRDRSGNWVYPSSVTSTRVLAHRAQAVDGAVFTPFAAADVTTVIDAEQISSTVPRAADRSVTPAGLKSVVGIRVSLAVTPPVGETGDAATFSNYVDFVSKVG
ncbi:prepilin-type N-terminal cleavage/methylation domain-containing protein [Kineococcus sp. TBRC 1896]|uniref:Prepilin-type N-terminal cleavage/methylation domain-containing protein n=1 Tax=Kineococcus mangrovi TaxID=1660183 RepID=A0ABV4I2P4_9ACTN